MNTNLLSIVKQITAQYGEDVLDDPRRVNALFGDLARDEPKPLRNAFGKCVEHGFYRILKNTATAAERREVIDRLAQRLRDEEGLDIALCAEALELLAAAIFGEGQIALPPESAPAAAPVSPPYQPPYQQPAPAAAPVSPPVQQPYQQPAPAAAPVSPPYQPPVSMIQKRSLAGMIVLSIITLGIYGLYWIHRLAKDANALCAGDGNKTSGLPRYFLFNLITLGVYGLVWVYMLGDRLRDNAPRYNRSFTEGGATVLLWLIPGSFILVGPFIAWYIIIKNVNALADEYNKTRNRGGY